MNEKIFFWNVRLFTKYKAARYILRFVYKLLPLVMLVAYPVLLVHVYFTDLQSLPKLVLVPMHVFLGVTLLRVIIDEQRPYERFDTPSVFGKTTKGKSFPSRHTASAFIIAMAFMYVDFWWGMLAMLIALLIELSRIMAGAHYIHDVLAGMAISIVAGWIFMFLL
ncbi:MAG: phosphatase PAP2 family protein [Ruminococcus sp.]|nr:phosphatase PAP2 family protein [Ruminococcus sp.]MBQ1638742.1 phosphatase PAP2 family protein [Ruminococcus sp.]MBQ1806086.1 phosphatase PAP2 family protein [Ruminococcus sp.]MBQ1814621.1 phosphatase PAP2 family protein [Ruminococcus sp.]MBQ1943653.1 phosphatase PAP2 family protein [Ruminococcus sp.]